MNKKEKIIKDYKHHCYKLVNNAGLLRNGRFKSKEFLTKKSKANILKYKCRDKIELE